DYLPGAQAQAADLSVEAPLVFVGYGIVDPSRGRDDYAGLDVKGKIVVMLSGAPSSIQTEERAHFSNMNTKRAEAAKRLKTGTMKAQILPVQTFYPAEEYHRDYAKR
ncbi:peptide-methionine (S)-S-oxide reductase, partial [Staphylococcus aureus]|uniref:peptide-methionine (S)-S-oxide reductase n=1 Tax=Staphylococcus aureus TaxID=1280 RepID=UPI0032B61846